MNIRHGNHKHEVYLVDSDTMDTEIDVDGISVTYSEASRTKDGSVKPSWLGWAAEDACDSGLLVSKPDIQDDDLILDHIPDEAECQAIRLRMTVEKFWPNVYHVNDHGNVDLLSIGYNRYNGAKIVRSWV